MAGEPAEVVGQSPAPPGTSGSAPRVPPTPDLDDYWAYRVAEKARRKVLGYFAIGTAAVSLVLTLYGIAGIRSLLEDRFAKIVESKEKQTVERLEALLKAFEAELGAQRLTVSTRTEEYLATLAVSPSQRGPSGKPSSGLIDLSGLVGPIQDQGATPATVGFSLAYAARAEAAKDGKTVPRLSGWGIYKSSLPADASDTLGTTFVSGLRTLTSTGAFSAVDWPQGQDKPNAGAKPVLRAKNWRRINVQQISELIDALKAGHVVLAGISVTREFYAVGENGVVALSPNLESLGGHGIVLVGFDSTSRQFTFANSWGTSWGASGFGKIRDSDLLRVIVEGFVLEL